MRMCLRWQPFECEEHAGRRTLVTRDGVQVRMDDAEVDISGVQPLEQGEQEDVEEWNARRMAAGMIGMRLPAHLEVIDAELAGMLMVIREAATTTDAHERRLLIMSDCLSAGSK